MDLYPCWGGRPSATSKCARLVPTRIGIEACGASRHWTRVLRGLGRQVMLIPLQYIKPYVRAREERCDRRRSDLRGDEPAEHAICQERRAAGGAEDARGSG